MQGDQKKAGVILSYLSQGIYILSGLFYAPFMLRLLGQNEYGLYQMVYAVVSNLSLLSFGFSNSYMRFYARHKARGEEEKIASLNGMFMTVFMCISVICIICGAVMITNIEVIFSDGLTAGEYARVRVLFILLIISMTLSFPRSVFISITAAHERYLFLKIIEVMQGILNPFIAIPLLVLGYGSVGMVSASLLLSAIAFAANAFFCIRVLNVHFCFRNFHFGMLKEMFVFTFFIFMNQIIDQVNWNIDKVLLGRFSGTVAVAVYGLGANINTMYLQFANAISYVFVSRVNRIVAESNDNRELTLLFTKVGRIQFIVLGLILSGFIIFGQQFMILWGGKEYKDSFTVAILLIFPVTFPLIQNLGIEIQRAKNMHKARSVVYFLISVCNLFISIPLIRAYGAGGAACGTAIALVAGNILFMNWYYYCRIGLDIIYFWKKIASFMPALILPGILGVMINFYVPIENPVIMLMGIAVYSITYFISMWFFGLNAFEKSQVMKILQKVHWGKRGK